MVVYCRYARDGAFAVSVLLLKSFRNDVPSFYYSNSASSSPGSSSSSSSDAMVSSWSWIMSFVSEPRTVFWPMGWTSARALRMRAR